jgi:hypothetical protein
MAPKAPEQTIVTVNDFLSGVGIQAARLRKTRYSPTRRTRLVHAPAFLDISRNGVHKERIEEYAENPRMEAPGQCGPDTDDEEGYVGLRTHLDSRPSCSPTSQGNNLRLRNRAVRRIVLSENENGSSSSEGSSSECPSPLLRSASLARRKNGNKNGTRKAGLKKSLGTRLFEASVATHGQPLDSLVVPPVSGDDKHNTLAVVQPLPFVPLAASETRATDRIWNRKATLVDPRKATPFSNASFCSTFQTEQHLRHASKDNTPYDKLTTWKTRMTHRSEEYPGSASPPLRRGQSRTKRGEGPKQRAMIRVATQREDYPALDLVSMSGVGATYHGTIGRDRSNR